MYNYLQDIRQIKNAYNNMDTSWSLEDFYNVLDEFYSQYRYYCSDMGIAESHPHYRNETMLDCMEALTIYEPQHFLGKGGLIDLYFSHNYEGRVSLRHFTSGNILEYRAEEAGIYVV